MLARLRRIALSVPVLIFGGLLLVYLLAGWFAFEPLVKWAAPKVVADRSGYQLGLEHAKFDPLRLSVDLQGLALREPTGKELLTMQRLFANFDAAGLLRRTLTFDEVRLERPVASVEIASDGRLNWLAFIEAMAGKAGTAPETPADSGPPRLVVRRFAMDKGRIDFVDHAVPGDFESNLDPLDLDLEELSTLPDDKGQHALTAHLGLGADVRWRGTFGLNPVTASGDVAIDNVDLARLQPYLERALHTARPEGKAALKLSYRAGYANQRVSLQLDQVGARLDALALRGGKDLAPAVALDSIALSGGQLDLQTRRVSFERLAVQGGKIGIVRSTDGRIDVQEWFTPAPPATAASAPVATAAPPAPPAPPASPASAASAPPWRVSLAQASVDGVALRFVDEGFAAPLTAEVAGLKLALQADATAGGGPPDVSVQGLNLAVNGVKLLSGKGAEPWFQLGQFAVEDAHATLSSREAGAARVRVSDGSLTVVRDKHGHIALLDAFDRAASAPAVAPKPASTSAASEPAWKYKVGKVEANKFSVALREESVAPVTSFALEGIEAGAENLSDDPKVSIPVRLGFNVKSGGRFDAHGSVVPGAPSADIRLALRGLALSPAQPYLAQFADLTLARGQVDTEGQLRYAKGQARYEGGFAARDLQVTEPGNPDPFLAWKHLSSRRLVATQSKLEIGELELARLDTRLIIAKDRTINITKAFHAKAAPAAAPAPAPTPKAAAQPSPYQVDVGRVRILDSEMEFADLSLALPFGARINGLQGQLVGLSTQPGRAAQIELAGQVDEYGSMRTTGKVELADPMNAMDIKVVFKNVEMTALTPYSATFAGRRIASGKLSLDLDYQLDKRQLKGENQVVMDQLTLGERVDSPGAMNLPLDLALAILQDSDGRIDLGLPVSGSLDDPQFSYGALIGKALLGLITKIVAAPFRAIGALFGGSGENAPEIAFDAGTAALPPPEREKLDTLAKALAKRPGLALSVHGAYSPRLDGAVLKELQLRRAVAAQTGREVPAGADPGPIASTQPEVQKALEALYAKAFGEPALQTLRTQHQRANVPPESASPSVGSRLAGVFKRPEEPLAADVAARLHGTDLHTLLLQRLLEREQAGDEQLTALGIQRADAIRARLVSHGIAAERVQVEPPAPQEGSDPEVKTKLDIAAAAKPGAQK